MSDQGKKRGRKLNDELPPSRSRDVQRAFRARRAAHLANLENRNVWLEDEVAALKLKLGWRPDQYASGPPPDEIEPDYDGVAEPERVRGSNRRTKLGGAAGRKYRTGEGSSKNNHSSQEDPASVDAADPAFRNEGSIRVEYPRSSSHETSPPLPCSQALPTPPALPHAQTPQNELINYGIYFVPKGSEQASFVGSTQYPPDLGTSNLGAHGTECPFQVDPRASTSSEAFFYSPAQFSRPLTSPDSLSSVSTHGIPATPPDAWATVLPRYDSRGIRRASQPEDAAAKAVFETFHRTMSRVFGKGQVSETDGDYSVVSRSTSRATSASESAPPPCVDDPLPSIKLPRFSSGLPGSTSTTQHPATDTYLHVSKAFEHLARFLVTPASSSSSTRSHRQFTPLDVVNLFQAHEQRNTLLSGRPETFDFARPPTCLFLPPFATAAMASPKKEMYLLSQAVDQVRRHLEGGESSSSSFYA
ncbi:hypothetical protein JCM3766R1_004536 [Sporobolomyces carnicolor]